MQIDLVHGDGRTGGDMYVSVPLAGLAVLFVLSSPAQADGQSELAQCKFVGEIGNADLNIAACDRALKDPKISGPNRAVALSDRCGWRWAQKDPDRALSDCDEAIKIDPNLAAAHINRGNVYLNKADVDRAFDDFNAAIRLDPKSAWAYSARGDIYKNKGDFDHAMADFNESIRLDPNYAMAYFFRGDLYKRKGDYDHAVTDLNDSIRLDPNYAMTYFIRANVSYIMGNGPAALADFTTSIRLDPDNAATHFNRGVAYFVAGAHVADAEADFRKAAELNPKDAYAALWQYLAQHRDNAPDHLTEAAKQLDMTAWPAPVVHQFLGELTSAQTVAAADDNDPKTKLGQTCEANFYGGEFALAKKKKQEALPLLRLAARDCPRSFIESTAAIAELIVQR
jgi:tetratricopeptide (TPR) repeat protein